MPTIIGYKTFSDFKYHTSRKFDMELNLAVSNFVNIAKLNLPDYIYKTIPKALDFIDSLLHIDKICF